jgi:formylmethanofuran dehydrogenase subunit B
MTSSELKVVKDATCTFCGCVCDDIELHVRGTKIEKAQRACVLGTAWFLNHEIEDAQRAIEGPGDIDEIERARRSCTG